MKGKDRARIVLNNPDSSQGEYHLAFAVLELLDRLGSVERQLEALERSVYDQEGFN